MKRKLKRPPYIHFVCACLVWSQEKKMNGKFKHGEIATKLRSQQRIWWSMQFTLTEMKEQLLRKEFVTLLIRGIWSTAKLKLLVCVTIKWYNQFYRKPNGRYLCGHSVNGESSENIHKAPYNNRIAVIYVESHVCSLNDWNYHTNEWIFDRVTFYMFVLVVP